MQDAQNNHHKDFTLRVMPASEVSASWPALSDLLRPAIEHCHGDLDLDDIRQLVGDGRAFVLVLERGGCAALAAVAEVLQYPRRKVLNIIATAGSNLDQVTGPFWHLVVDIGHILGVQAVRGSVRPSMQRLYRRIAPDATVAYNILERAI